MLDDKYDPATDTVGVGMDFKYTRAQAYLYAVFLKTVKTPKTKPKGKSILNGRVRVLFFPNTRTMDKREIIHRALL